MIKNPMPKDRDPRRDDWLCVNHNLREIADKTGLELEYVYCGEHPNDFTGDSIRDAMGKLNRNFEKIEQAL
jgi:hypothetical protein